MSYIYFIKPIGVDGPIKIGCSTIPENRLDQLTIWSPWPLEILCTAAGNYKDENFLHSCFASDHSHREWFRSSPRLRAIIDEIARTGSLDVARANLTPTGSIRSAVNRKFSAEGKMRQSYRMRVYWAERKLLEALGKNSKWRTPSDVTGIPGRWSGYGKAPQSPSQDEMERLDEYLKNPADHSVSPHWLTEREAA